MAAFSLTGKNDTVLLPELDFLSLPANQIGISQVTYSKILPQNPLNPDSLGPIRFNLSNGSKNYTNLHKSTINYKFSIRDSAGQVIPAVDTRIDPKTLDAKGVAIGEQKSLPTTFCQAVGRCFHRSVTLYLNSQAIERHANINASYKSIIMDELQHSSGYKENTLSLAGWHKASNIANAADWSYQQRVESSKVGKSTTVSYALPVDLGGVNRLLPNFIHLELEIYLNDAKWILEELEGGSERNPKVVLESVWVNLCEYSLEPQLDEQFQKHLLKEPIHYPHISIQSRAIYLEAGRLELSPYVCFSSHMCKRLNFVLLDAASYTGSYTSVNQNFQHFNLKCYSATVNGVTYPTNAKQQLNFKQKEYTAAYQEMLDAHGLSRNYTFDNGISYKKFGTGGYAIFSIPISPSCVYGSSVFDLAQPAQITLNLEFSEPTARPLYCIILGEFNSVLSIDSDRNPHLGAAIL